MKLERNLGVLPQFERHGVPHPLEIRPDSLALIRTGPRESTYNTKGGLIPRFEIREKPQVPIQLHWRPETSFTAGKKSRVSCLNTVET